MSLETYESDVRESSSYEKAPGGVSRALRSIKESFARRRMQRVAYKNNPKLELADLKDERRVIEERRALRVQREKVAQLRKEERKEKIRSIVGFLAPAASSGKRAQRQSVNRAFLPKSRARGTKTEINPAFGTSGRSPFQ